MTSTQTSILLVLVAGALGGCVSGAHGGDPDLDSGPDPASRRPPRPAPAPAPAPDPGSPCTLIGGPSTLGATLDGVDYEVTGGPTGNGDGTSLHMAQDGSVTLHTSERGTEHGWLDGLTLYGLFHRVTNAQLPTLCTMYSCADCGADRIHNLTVWLNNFPYTVRASFAAVPPTRLTSLIDWVQEITTHPPE
jgi:hypothetical protein